MTPWRGADADAVRARIASLSMRDAPAESRLGDVHLRIHQREAAGRLREAIDRFGGALLADDVGLGKTYTALAAARGSNPLLIVAPAAIATMWTTALAHAGIDAQFVSFETLSRRDPEVTRPGLVIVDEAHHARNPSTQRYARLAALTRSSAVLLLSATPVHNASSDLHALLALFLGARAERLTPAQLAACIVRRARADVHDMTVPHRSPPVWLEVGGPSDVLQALVDIPPPCPPRDGADGGALITIALVRAWASTEAALRSALLRRVARATSLADALASGRHPTRSELLAWVMGDDATQLAFPELMGGTMTPEWRALHESVDRHAAGVRRVLAVIANGDDRGDGPNVDDRRCALVRGIRARHAGERVIVFSQFADSVHAMFTRLRGDGRVAAMTASGAMVAGGVITRADALARFAPRGTGSASPRAAEAIDLLIATDLLSEGLNLQDASVVVHLDLPWTAARLTQRLGRIWRMGSPHARVHEYALGPPVPADRLLRLTEILMAKAGAAAQAVGDAIAPLLTQRASPHPGSGDVDPVSARESLRRTLHRWVHPIPDEAGHTREATSELLDPTAAADAAAVAAVRAPVAGWIAALSDGESTHIVAKHGDDPATTNPVVVLGLARVGSGRACVVAPARVSRALSEIQAYEDARRAASDAGLTTMGSRAHAAATSRIAAVAAAAPAHRRLVVSRLAASARRAVANTRSAGAERLLGALLTGDATHNSEGRDAEEWLARIVALETRDTPNADDATAEPSPPRLRALLLLIR